jgi:flagellar biosynthesis chaperone FliJ
MELLSMKRQSFRLGSVLRYYELQKQRTEFELQRACRTLQETDMEITRLGEEIAALARLLHVGATPAFSADGWIACYRKSEQLGKTLTTAHTRRVNEAAVVAQLEETRKKWSIAEEALRAHRHEIETFNRAESDKAQQAALDETVLRKWLNNDSDLILEA